LGQQKKVIIGETVEGEKKPTGQDIKKGKDQPKKELEVAKREVKPEEKAVKIDKPRVGKAKIRSRRYLAFRQKVDRNRSYSQEEAVEKVKALSKAGFDETIELHIKLVSKKGEKPFRQMVELPGGLTRKPRVIVLNQEKINQIKRGKIDFDIVLAEPQDMAKVTKLAKILGPKGLMPNPKLGTVTKEPDKVKQRLETRLKEIKADDSGNLHLAVGKVSWDDKKIIGNIEAILQKIPKAKVEKITLCSTMGLGIKMETGRL
jgi:large subunit ribosomal protein L1